MKLPLYVVPVLLIVFPALVQAATSEKRSAQEEGPVDFSRDIKPLLHRHCAECHGGVKSKGGLSLVTKARAFGETKSGELAITPGHPEKSELVARITSRDEDERMPPEEALSKTEIDLLTRWIAEGARWPEHWSWRKITRPAAPSVPNTGWIRSEIDRFVLSNLNAKKVKPSASAPPRILIRRLSLDLLGLLPEPDRVERFVSDFQGDPEKAWSNLVDEFLESPHFGERWARHWLDEARYADSAGYEKDSARADAYHFRDWVIRAMNEDMPFDQFTIRQIAGDLLPGASTNDRVATKFHLMTQFNLEGGVDAEEDRTKRVIDRITTVGSVWLASTVECAQCHNHPYDPLTQADFYRLYAFFNNSDYAVTFAGERPKDADERIKKRQEKWLPVAKMIEQQVTNKNLATRLQGALGQMRRFDNDQGFTRVLSERSENRRKTYIFDRGNFQQPLTSEGEMHPGVPAMFNQVPDRQGKTANRLDLARWIVSPENPLTARAAVNKAWLHLFGAPLAGSPRDFGMSGLAPAHPELLDWLAHFFVHDGKWSRKAMIREIVSSAAYRQSSAARPELADVDPGNEWFARQNRFRVEGEIVRDISLQAAGLLSRKIGGPSVFPPIPADVAALSYANNFKWKVSQGDDRFRRGMYTFFKRTAPDPNLTTFDCPDASMTSARRGASNTPLQALAALQNEVFLEAARAFAKRLLEEANLKSDESRIARAYALALSRQPISAERDALLELLEESRSFYEKETSQATELTADYRAASVSEVDCAAWITTIRVILNLDEFLSRA